MAQINQEEERERLQKLYAGMSDGQLEKIASDWESLTDTAKSVLRTELSSRGIPVPAETATPLTGTSKPMETATEHPAPVMLRRYRDLPEATVAQSVLESAGIESFLADDNLVRMDWFYSNLIGGVKLFVPEKDAEIARTLLEQSTPTSFEVEGVGEYEQPKCPQCGSLDVSFNGIHKRSSYASLLVGVPIPITDKGWRCHLCGHSWEEEADSEALDG
jgi:hypothetical protein